jgi:hypothetical protein
MTLLQATFFYAAPLRESTLRALDEVREVYGVRQMSLNDGDHAIQVEYDASPLMSERDPAALLRDAGIDVRQRVGQVQT